MDIEGEQINRYLMPEAIPVATIPIRSGLGPAPEYTNNNNNRHIYRVPYMPIEGYRGGGRYPVGLVIIGNF